jgi:hypothetical protein
MTGHRLAPLLLALAASRAAAAPAWDIVAREDGVTVTRRDVPGRGFPTFRGVGVVEAPVWDVLAVLSDIPRYPAWQVNCVGARLVHLVSETDWYVYSRLHAPWPVSDRDALYHAMVHPAINRDGQLVVDIRFTAARLPQAPPVKGVVRMEKIRGFFRLTALSASRTLMDFEADADPGGRIPRWLAEYATKRIPLDTIRVMRTRVRQTRGWYEERIRRWKEMEAALRAVAHRLEAQTTVR